MNILKLYTFQNSEGQIDTALAYDYEQVFKERPEFMTWYLVSVSK